MSRGQQMTADKTTQSLQPSSSTGSTSNAQSIQVLLEAEKEASRIVEKARQCNFLTFVLFYSSFNRPRSAIKGRPY